MPKILIADDESDIRLIIGERLKVNGYEIINAEDGQEALSQARGEKPDLILLDIMMPKLDGFKVCRMLKFDTNFKNIPIVIISALSQESNQNLGHEVGADAYFVKPFNSEDLLAKISELLQKTS